MHSLATRGGNDARPPPSLAAPGPVTGCPEGRLHWAILLTQQACLSVPAPSCWLTAPSLGPCLSSHSPFPPCGPAGTHSATWGCWGSRRPLGLGGVQRLGPRKALLDVRAVLCSVLPASPSSPAEHGVAQPTFSVRQVHPSQSPCPAPVAAAMPCAGYGAALGDLSECSHRGQMVGGGLGTSLPLPRSPSESSQPCIQRPGQQRPWRAEVCVQGQPYSPSLPCSGVRGLPG